jgi:hypothetical protein
MTLRHIVTACAAFVLLWTFAQVVIAVAAATSGSP